MKTKKEPLKVSNLSKRTLRIREHLKPLNNSTIKTQNLIDFIKAKENCSRRTAYRIMKELHVSNQIASTNTYLIDLNR